MADSGLDTPPSSPPRPAARQLGETSRRPSVRDRMAAFQQAQATALPVSPPPVSTASTAARTRPRRAPARANNHERSASGSDEADAAKRLSVTVADAAPASISPTDAKFDLLMRTALNGTAASPTKVKVAGDVEKPAEEGAALLQAPVMQAAGSSGSEQDVFLDAASTDATPHISSTSNFQPVHDAIPDATPVDANADELETAHTTIDHDLATAIDEPILSPLTPKPIHDLDDNDKLAAPTPSDAESLRSIHVDEIPLDNSPTLPIPSQATTNHDLPRASFSSASSSSSHHLDTPIKVYGIVLVDFDHALGPKVEYSFPEDLVEDPVLSTSLPFLALPDGAHMV